MKTTNADDFVLQELTRLRADLKATQQRLKATWAVCFALLLGGLGLAASPTAQAQIGNTLVSLNARLTAVENRLTAAEAKTTPLTYDATSKLLTISGANVRIIDGTGTTESTSGLGNLQVGYNIPRISGNVRTGSHNLIIGDRNNYASFGGMVAGYFNSISGVYASVSGGISNTASGGSSSVSGGDSNTASGNMASVSGGRFNTASNAISSVSGGTSNTASGFASSILGGDTILLNTNHGTYP